MKIFLKVHEGEKYGKQFQKVSICNLDKHYFIKEFIKNSYKKF